jgi:hypothetical protein
MSETRFRAMKDLPAAHLLGAGTAMCAGCGGLEALHQIYDILGEKTVFINAAGCMTLLAIYPYTPFGGSWLYSAMASAPAGAQGVRDALDILLAKGRISPEEDLTAVVLTGDGSAYGMGLSATSGAIERGLDFIYVCYDNEGYGNTGQQYSGATPHGARTSTSRGCSGFPGFKKDLFAVLGGAPAVLRGDRRGRGTARPRAQDRKGEGACAAPAHPGAGALPTRGGTSIGRGGPDRQAGRGDRRVAAQGIFRRRGDLHQGAEEAAAGGGNT